MTTRAAPANVSHGRRWAARLALVSAGAAVLVLLVGGLRSVGVLAVGVGGLVAMLAGGWWFLRHRGLVRWLAAALIAVAFVGVLVLYVAKGVLWAVILLVALAALAAAAGRQALAGTTPPARMPERRTPAPRRPFVIMNPRSGGGKVGTFHLDEKAAGLGAQVALLDGPGPVDVAALARRAVADGADLLGVAGGDGTQALVAGIAAEHQLPFLVISAGTRNHFAMDLGLDRDHPDTGLDALRDGVELQLDLGRIGDRTFVNNASFGAYAEVVQSPAYRDDKRGTTLRLLPDLLSGARGPRLRVTVDGTTVIEAPKAVLVSNNPYDFDDLAGLGRRRRIDTGILGVVAVTVDNAAQAAALLRGRRAGGVQRFEAHEVVVDADADAIPVGIDGEAVMMPTPVRCTIVPRALRVRVPRERPGVAVTPRWDLAALLHEAVGRP